MILETITTEVCATFSDKDIRKILNSHYIGSENCNMIDETGNIIPVEHENMDHLKKAQLNVCPNIRFFITVDVTDNGRLINPRIVK